jgi:cytochrome c553
MASPRSIKHMPTLAAGLLILAACQGKQPAERGASGDVGAGKALAERICAACHGIDGNGTAAGIPKLAGQYPEYLRKQLLAFRPTTSGAPKRTSVVMQGIAMSLTPDDIQNVSAYYAGQALILGLPRDSRRLSLGRKIYAEGNPQTALPACTTCHRPSGTGIRPDFPQIGGQDPDYLDDQLAHWEERRGHPGKLMSMIAPHLDANERRAVSDYLAQLAPDRKQLSVASH